MKDTKILRKDHEPPIAVAKWRWRYHHMGIPTKNPIPGEKYYSHLKMHVSGFETSPFGIEWMRFDPDCVISELVKTVPHIAFEVDNIESALEKLGMNAEITSPAKRIRVTMIVHNGAPIELIEFHERIKNK